MMIKRNRFDKLSLGLILGIIVPILSIFIYYFASTVDMNFSLYIKTMLKKDVFTQYMSLCAIPNLLLFFIFIWKEFNFSARGVLMATIIFAIINILLKFVIL